MTKQQMKATAEQAVARARTAAVKATDAALVRMGNAAKQRQRSRAVKATLKAAGKMVLIAGAAAATVAAVRAGARRAKA
jgi:hypothetical protein